MNEAILKIKNWLARRKQVIIGLLTVVLIIFMILLVDLPNFINKFLIIGILGFFFFTLLYTIAFIFRAYKLKVIFKGIEQNLKFSSAYFSIGTCFVINEVTPAKLGELAKIGFIKDQTKIELGNTICGVTIERFLDFILLFLISCIALIYLYYNNLNNPRNLLILGQNIQLYLALGAIFIICIIIGLFLLIYKTEFVLKLIEKISSKIARLLRKFILNFKEGMKKFRNHKKQFVYVILLGFPTWLFDSLIIVLFFYILGYKLNILLLVLAVILLFFTKSFPITPGGWGISENIGALFIFIFYPDIAFVEILSIFIIDHLFRTAYIYFYGGYSIFHYNFKLKDIKKELF